jgi:hypothetical protein
MMGTGSDRCGSYPLGDVARVREYILSREFMSSDPEVDPSEDTGTHVDPSEDPEGRGSVDPSEGPSSHVDPSEGPTGRKVDPSEGPGLTGPDPWDD